MNYQQKREAELLIQDLPTDHSGRNSWLAEHGTSVEADRLRVIKILKDTSTTPEEKADKILKRNEPVNSCSPVPQMPSQGSQSFGQRW